MERGHSGGDRGAGRVLARPAPLLRRRTSRCIAYLPDRLPRSHQRAIRAERVECPAQRCSATGRKDRGGALVVPTFSFASMSFQLMAWAVQQITGSPTRKAVLMSLANRASHDTKRCVTPIGEICAETEFRERAVRQALDDLEELQLIARQRVRSSGGALSHYVYTLAAGDAASEAGLAAGDAAIRARDVVELNLELRDLNLKLEKTVEQEQNRDPESFESSNGSRVLALFSSELLSQDSSPSESVQEVYDHWREHRKKRDARYNNMSAARRDVIRKRLEEFTVPQLKRAIDGVCADPWRARARYDDLPIIFRKREDVDRWIEIADSPTGKGELDLIARVMSETRLGRMGGGRNGPRAS